MTNPGMPAETEARFASALEKIADAVAKQAESNALLAETFARMGTEMGTMTRTIQGAQKKIGGELGAVIESGQNTNRKLNDELARARKINADS